MQAGRRLWGVETTPNVLFHGPWRPLRYAEEGGALFVSERHGLYTPGEGCGNDRHAVMEDVCASRVCRKNGMRPAYLFSCFDVGPQLKEHVRHAKPTMVRRKVEGGHAELRRRAVWAAMGIGGGDRPLQQFPAPRTFLLFA
jgi:hypothetical protein